MINKTIINYHTDILVLVETKLDDTFPIIKRFSKPYRLDRNRHGGGLLIYIREDIPSKKLIKHTFHNYIEGLCIEINLRKFSFAGLSILQAKMINIISKIWVKLSTCTTQFMTKCY